MLREQLVELELHRAAAVVRLERVMTLKSVPGAIRRASGRAHRALRDHLEPGDLAGALRDVAGVPVRRPGGSVYQHNDEVIGVLNSLEDAKEVMTRSLPDGRSGSWDADAHKVGDAVVALRQMRKAITDVTGIKVPQ